MKATTLPWLSKWTCRYSPPTFLIHSLEPSPNSAFPPLLFSHSFSPTFTHTPTLYLLSATAEKGSHQISTCSESKMKGSLLMELYTFSIFVSLFSVFCRFFIFSSIFFFCLFDLRTYKCDQKRSDRGKK